MLMSLGPIPSCDGSSAYLVVGEKQENHLLIELINAVCESGLHLL